MKKLMTFLVPIAAALALLAGPAAADDIACPTDQVRTEITTSLPDPWWQTPQVGSLQNTRVGEVAGETTLFCEYWAYGTTVSVMRHPPEGMINCTAHEGGFTCQRQIIATPLPIPLPGNLGTILGGGSSGGSGGETPSVTYRTGPLSIPQTWQADFDSGQVGSGTADIWFHAVTATERYLEPMNGAQFGIYAGGSGISKGDCVSTPKTTNRIPVASAPVGTYVCYLTSDGRHGAFRVNEPVGPSPGTLEIGFTTWQ